MSTTAKGANGDVTKPAKPVRSNTFASMGNMLSAGFDSGLMSDANDQMVSLLEIHEPPQVRDDNSYEDDEQSLADLGKSLRRDQVQSILLRTSPEDRTHGKPFELVAGYRRVRAARIEGLTELRAHVRPMSDEETEYAQFVENTHRKNLTQIEEARRLQRDLDVLGSTGAVLAKYNKESAGAAWLSKRLALLTLPPQAARLMRENISSDLEVIGKVKAVEKVDPGRATQLVDDLKDTRGKGNARDQAESVRLEVKPAKVKPDRKASTAEGVATARERGHEKAGAVHAFTPSDIEAPSDVLNSAYTEIFDRGRTAQTVMDGMRSQDREDVDTWLRAFYDAGRRQKDTARVVTQGLRDGTFWGNAGAAFALIAFLHGSGGKQQFNALEILSTIRG